MVCTAIGALLLLVCIAWLSLGAWRSTSNIKWAQYKPDWWLHREALTADARKRDAALEQLFTRAKADEISDARLRSLAEHALKLQADGSAAWSQGWSNLVLESWRQDLLTPEQRERFAKAAVAITFKPRTATVRRWEITILHAQLVSGGGPQADVAVTLTPIDCTIGEAPTLIDTSPRSNLRVGGGALEFDIPILVEAGEYEIESAWRIDVQPRNSAGGPASWEARLTTPLRVLPEAEDAPELVVGPEADEALRESFRVEAVGLRRSQSAGPGAPVGARVALLVEVEEAPFSAALRLRVTAGGSVSRRGTAAHVELLVGQSYERKIKLGGAEAQGDTVTLTAENLPRFLSRAVPKTASLQRRWYGRPFEIATVPIVWYDSIDDPEMPEALRERLTRTQDPQPAQQFFQMQEPSQ